MLEEQYFSSFLVLLVMDTESLLLSFIKSSLPKLRDPEPLLEHLQGLGVEDMEDLSYLQESDLLSVLRSIEARKLLSLLKKTSMCFNLYRINYHIRKICIVKIYLSGTPIQINAVQYSSSTMNYTSKNLLCIFVDVFKKVITINYTLFIIDFIVGVSGGVLYCIILRKELFEIYQLATEYIIMLGINIPRLSYVMSVWLNITTICPL